MILTDLNLARVLVYLSNWTWGTRDKRFAEGQAQCPSWTESRFCPNQNQKKKNLTNWFCLSAESLTSYQTVKGSIVLVFSNGISTLDHRAATIVDKYSRLDPWKEVLHLHVSLHSFNLFLKIVGSTPHCMGWINIGSRSTLCRNITSRSPSVQVLLS